MKFNYNCYLFYLRLISFFLIFFSAKIFAINSTTDSLANLLKTKLPDTVKIDVLNQLSYQLSRSNLDSAEKTISLALELREKDKETSLNLTTIKIYGLILILKGNYPLALKNLLNALKKAQDLKNHILSADIMVNISTAYHYQSPENFSDAIKYLENALEIYIKEKHGKGVALCYENLGNIYCDNISKATFNLKLSADYFEKALDFYVKENNELAMARIYNNLSYVFDANGINQKSIELLEKALKIFQKTNDEMGMMSSYFRLGDAYQYRNNYKEALVYLNKALDLAKKTGNKDYMNNIYEVISNVYNKMGDYKNALKYYYSSVEIKFELHNIERINTFAELEKKFESEKKEKEIQLLNKEKEVQQGIISKQQLVRNFLFGVVALILFSAFVMLRAYLSKKKANIKLNILNQEILSQKREIEEKNEELNQQNEEITTQRDEIDFQKKILEETNKEILDSIHYAKRIQDAVLPSDQYLSEFPFNVFVIFYPRNIVSGDFYWFAKRGNWAFFAAADCTGHGVPGAFMSMLGIASLNEIIARSEIKTASNVLDELRNVIISSLQKTSASDKIKQESLSIIRDGMDITFCAINTDTLELQFAGANNPLWIVKSPQSAVFKSHSPQSSVLKNTDSGLPTTDFPPQAETADPHTSNSGLSTDRLLTFELIEIKGDKQPIGIYENMNPFTNHVVQLQKNDRLFIFSDGYADQFGGPSASKGGKKFKYAQLKNIILKTGDLNLSEQKTYLENAYFSWKGNYEQIDDVLLIGLRI